MPMLLSSHGVGVGDMNHVALNETPHELATIHPAKLFPFVLNFSLL